MSIPIEDFEDALVSSCAKKAEADDIISRDDKLLREKSPVKVIEPKALDIKAALRCSM